MPNSQIPAPVMPDTKTADATPIWFDPSLCLIGGVWTPACSGETLALVDPSDGSNLCQIARGGAADIDAAVAAAEAALAGADVALLLIDAAQGMHGRTALAVDLGHSPG